MIVHVNTSIIAFQYFDTILSVIYKEILLIDLSDFVLWF